MSGVQRARNLEASNDSPALMTTYSLNHVEAQMSGASVLLTAFAAIGGLLLGYDSGSINGIIRSQAFVEAIEGSSDAGKLSKAHTALIISILFGGAFIGSIAAGHVADKIGRRWTIISGCVIYSAGVIVQMMVGVGDGDSLGAVVAGRLVSGVGVGFMSSGVVLYMSETCPRKLRGALVASFQCWAAVGLLVASIIVYAVDDYDDASVYRILIGLQFPWPTILGIGLLLHPESPRYFVNKDETMQAQTCLAQLRGYDKEDHPRIQYELSELIIDRKIQSHLPTFSEWARNWFSRLSRGSLRDSGIGFHPLTVGILLQTMLEWTGISYIMHFSTPLLEATNIIDDPLLITLIFTIVSLCSTPLSLWTIERYGRRRVLITGAVGMAVCHFLVAIIGVTAGLDQTHRELGDHGRWMADNRPAVNAQIVLVAIFVFFFASSWGPASWVVVGEIFPVRTRARAVGYSLASHWFWKVVVVVAAPYVIGEEHRHGQSFAFFLWGALCLCAFASAYLIVPEPKEWTLEQVTQMMREGVGPRNSSRWSPSETLAGRLGISSLPQSS